jgi:oligopeptide/dipeptide ABC transporter, ATP-binding protein, C-terminal domain
MTFEVGDAEQTPFEDNTFDVVVNRHLLWTSLTLDSSLMMYAGEIVEEGKDVFDRPLHPYTRVLLDAARYMSLEVVVPAEVGELPDGFSGCSYYRLCREKTDSCKKPQKLQDVSGDW